MEIKLLAEQGIEFPPERLAEELALAERALQRYPLAVKDLGLVQAKEKAVVWRVETVQGPKALKWTGLKGGKAVFSLFAQEYLDQMGFPVPKVLRTLDGQLYLAERRRVGFVCDWIEGRPVQRENPEEWQAFVRALAKFHRLSQGLQVPPGVRVKTKLGGWPLEYQAKIGQLKQWYLEAGYRRHPFARLYRELAPTLIERAEKLLVKLVRSVYWDWVERAARKGGLCHGDYGNSNTVVTEEGRLYVIDLDTVTYDLPIRDLRKLFEDYLEPGNDLAAALQHVVETYIHYNPLNERQLAVYLIDIQFPYDFYDAARKGFDFNERDEAMLAEAAEADLARSEALALPGPGTGW